MDINQLATILTHIDTSLHDTGLLACYARLIETLIAVVDGESAEMARIQALRGELVDLLEQAEPLGWSVNQLETFRTYGAERLLGDVAVERINAAFVENFMNPSGLLVDIITMQTESIKLAEKADVLLKGLDPVLSAPELLKGEIIDAPVMAQRTGISGLFERINLPSARNGSTAVVPANDVAFAAKFAAAAPVMLAAAGKALELYRAYSEAKSVLKKNEPAVIRPKQTVQPTPEPTTYMRYTYQRSVYIFNQRD